MKKLMIAAGVAGAMISGVYATEGCADCGNVVVKQAEEVTTVEVDTCFTEAYNVQFKLKALASKGVKSGDCQGYCMEQGNRTIDGILWSCCSDCANWDGNQAGDFEFQYCLWEKANKLCFTDGLSHVNGTSETTTKKYKYTYNARYTLLTGTVVGGDSYTLSGFDYGRVADARNAANSLITAFNNNGYIKDTHAYTGAYAGGINIRQKQLAATEKNYLSYTFVWVDEGNAIDPTHVNQANVTITRSGTVGTTEKWEDTAADQARLIAQWNNEIAGGSASAAAIAGVNWVARWVNSAGEIVNFTAGQAPSVGGTVTYAQIRGNATYQDADGKDLVITTTQDAQPYAYFLNWDGSQFVVTGEGKTEEAAKAAITFPTFATAAELTAFNTAAGTALVANNSSWVLQTVTEQTTKVEDGEETTPAYRSRYLDTVANIFVYRYSKKADKAEALWNIDTDADAKDGAGLHDDDVNLALTAAGFGTACLDKTYSQYYVKSLSGNCAGCISPMNVAADCAGSIISMCDELSSWCTDGFVCTLPTSFTSGTWTMKYITKASKGIWGLVPDYAK